MNLRLEHKLEIGLENAARRISDAKYLPVDVDKLCNQFNVKVHRTNKKLESDKALLIVTNKGTEIHLSINREGYTNRERFMIVHELGHLILDRDFGINPLGKSEYWKHEDLCDYFARIVLLPDNFLKKSMKNTINTPSQRLGLIAFLAKSALVPWAAAAYRVTDFDESIFFFEFEVTTSNNRIKGQEFRATVSTLPDKKYQGTKLSSNNKLGCILAQIKDKKRPLILDHSLFQDHDLGEKFPIFLKAQAGAALKSPHNKIHIAIRLIDDKGVH